MVGCIHFNTIHEKGAEGPLKIFEFSVQMTIIAPRLAFARRDSFIYNLASDTVIYSSQVCSREEQERVIDSGKKEGPFLN